MRRRALAGQLDQLKAERNEAAKADGRMMKEKGALPADVVAQRKRLGERIGALEAELRDVETALEAKALYVPNLPLPELPDGDASHNAVVRSWGAPAEGGGRPHWEIAERLGILDLRRGALLSGSGFPVFVGQGTRPASGGKPVRTARTRAACCACTSSTRWSWCASCARPTRRASTS